MALPTNTGSDGNQKPNSGLPTPSNQNDGRQQAPVGYPAPRGGLPTPTSPLQRPVAPPPAPPEPDPFEQLSVEEAIEEEIYEEPYRAPALPQQSFDAFEETPAPSRREPTVNLEQEPIRARDPIELDDDESNFVNEKQKKLLPFGGSKSKKSKAGKDSLADEFDAREDRRTKARIVQIGALTALFGIVGFGGYNAINPPVGVTADEMNVAITAAIATQNFPLERGGSFAEEFVSAFLTINPNNAENELLGYYYTGVLGSSPSVANIETNNVNQTILVAPKVFKATPLDANSAAFEVGSLVEVSPALDEAPDDNATPGQTETIAERAKWVYYNVNVYYDPETDTMAVTQDSPSLIPNVNFGAAADIPDEKLLGNGQKNDEVAQEVRTPLFGYLEAFAESSASDHDALDQYLISGGSSDPALVKGLADQFEFAGEASDSIVYTAYDTGEPNTTKIDVTVKWADKKVVDTGATLTYSSRYYVEMKKVNGQWFVSAFAPKYFLVKAPTP